MAAPLSPENIAVLGLGCAGLPLALVMGVTFKEGYADTCESKVANTVAELRSDSVSADDCESWAARQVMASEHGIETASILAADVCDAINQAVSHGHFVEFGVDKIRALGKPGALVYDIKGVFGKSGLDLRL